MKSYLKIFLIAILAHCSIAVTAQTNPTIEVLTQGNKTSIRGLSVVSEKIVWANNGQNRSTFDGAGGGCE